MYTVIHVVTDSQFYWFWSLCLLTRTPTRMRGPIAIGRIGPLHTTDLDQDLGLGPLLREDPSIERERKNLTMMR